MTFAPNASAANGFVVISIPGSRKPAARAASPPRYRPRSPRCWLGRTSAAAPRHSPLSTEQRRPSSRTSPRVPHATDVDARELEEWIAEAERLPEPERKRVRLPPLHPCGWPPCQVIPAPSEAPFVGQGTQERVNPRLTVPVKVACRAALRSRPAVS